MNISKLVIFFDGLESSCWARECQILIKLLPRDITLRSGEQERKVSRYVLIKFSEVFKDLLTQPTVENETGVIELSIDLTILSAMLSVYDGEPLLPEFNSLPWWYVTIEHTYLFFTVMKLNT